MNGIKQVLLTGALLAVVAMTGCAGVGVQAISDDVSSFAPSQLEDITLSMHRDSQGG